MKNQSLLLCIALLLSACQADHHKLLPSLQDTSNNENANKLWANTRLLDYQNGKSFNYKMKSTADFYEQKNELSVLLAFELTKNKFDLPWEYLDGIAQQYFEKERINPSIYAPEYGVSLQYAALEIAHRAGINAPPTQERNQALEYYMDILIAQKGVDCDAMAELTTALKPVVSSRKYNVYRRYVINLAKEELEQSTLKLEKYRKEIESNEANAQENPILQADLAHYLDKYLSAKEALDLLRGDG